MATISLCMIARNEEKTLGRCLESVAGIPDEIIIVDTGSDDATKEVAGKFTSQVMDFEWVDDFSAARNYSFAQASMDYVLWLDADDILLPLDRTKLLDVKNMLTPDVDAVSMLYHTNFDESNNVTRSTRRLRLLKRSKNFIWTGIVHEDIESDSLYRYLNTDIVVTHRKEIDESGPSRRNLDILENYFKKGGQARPTDIFNYARELQMHKEFTRAIPQFLQFLATEDVKPELAVFALNCLATSYYMSGDLDKEWECTLKSLQYDIPRPEFSCRIGERFLRENRFQQAIFWYNLALENPGGTNDWFVDSHPFTTWLPHKQLALCYYQLGDHRRSLHHNVMARNFLPNDPDIATNIRFLEEQLKVSGADSHSTQT